MAQQGEPEPEAINEDKRLLEKAIEKIERLENKVIELATELRSYKEDMSKLINPSRHSHDMNYLFSA